MKRLIFLILCCLLFSGCQKKEEPSLGATLYYPVVFCHNIQYADSIFYSGNRITHVRRVSANYTLSSSSDFEYSGDEVKIFTSYGSHTDRVYNFLFTFKDSNIISVKDFTENRKNISIHRDNYPQSSIMTIQSYVTPYL